MQAHVLEFLFHSTIFDIAPGRAKNNVVPGCTIEYYKNAELQIMVIELEIRSGLKLGLGVGELLKI